MISEQDKAQMFHLLSQEKYQRRKFQVLISQILNKLKNLKIGIHMQKNLKMLLGFLEKS